MNGVGERLRSERERLGLSQRAFGDLGGVQPNAQGNYEKDERSPSADYLAAIAGHGVDVLYILTGRREVPAEGAMDEEERDLIAKFRFSDEFDKTVVRRVLGLTSGLASI